MKIILLAIGKTQTEYIRKAVDEYRKKIVHYIPMDIVTIPDQKYSKSISELERKDKEGEQILSQLQPSDKVVRLDEKGVEFSSREFAGYLQKQSAGSYKRLVFVIGGPYGFSEKVKDEIKESISLSRMTFSHEMVRLFFTEQIYRAMTILKGEPYHHD